MLDTAKMLADSRLDRRANLLATITPQVPVFVCRNLLMLADRNFKNPAEIEVVEQLKTRHNAGGHK